MLKPRNAVGIFLYVNIVSWLLLLAIKLIAFFGFSEHVSHVNFYLKGLLLNLFLLLVYFYFSSAEERYKQYSFVELLSRLFLMGLVCNSFSILIQITLYFLEEQPATSDTLKLIINVVYHLDVALVAIFISQAFFYWKQMVLHERNEQLVRTWNTFEFLLLISLLFNFFEFDLSHLPFSISFGILMIFSLVLSVNLKWVAYLNSKEKWQSILFLLFISLFSYYFFYRVINHANQPYLLTNLMHSVYILSMFAFVIFYSIFSLLVILFNLPTTSVFEKKMEEVLSFRRLAQSLQSGEKEDHVYQILMDSAVRSCAADAGWLEIRDEHGKPIDTLYYNVDAAFAERIKRIQKQNKRYRVLRETFTIKPGQPTLQDELAKQDFSSMLSVPLVINEKSLGSLNLLKKVAEGFTEENKELLHTFTHQASISIENYRLLSKTIEAERYKEELKIAQQIQKQLLPQELNKNEFLEIQAYSESAYEVGGDYYDIHFSPEGTVLIVVGDVSGKGTTAAFHMSQMKGVFQSLASMDFNTRDFLLHANQAMMNCLDRSSFITLTVMRIDPAQGTLEFTRAGHCPTLMYQKKDHRSIFFHEKGMGLGIVRNPDYGSYLESQCIPFAPDDIVLLYTDGIVEARNARKEEYGYERLKDLLGENAHLESKHILDTILSKVKDFCKGSAMEDDHTAVLIKFKAPPTS